MIAHIKKFSQLYFFLAFVTVGMFITLIVLPGTDFNDFMNQSYPANNGSSWNPITKLWN